MAVCEQCGKILDAGDVPPLCIDHYVECMEEYDRQKAEGLAQFILKMGSEPGVTIHFPTEKGMMKIEGGEISPSKFLSSHKREGL